MPKVLVNDENLTNIANAIREKNGETTTYLPSEMASAISGIQSGGGSIKIEVQQYTPTTNEDNHIFTHNLGVIPDVVLIYAHKDTLSSSNGKTLYLSYALRKGSFSLGQNRYMLQSSFFKNSSNSGATVEKYCACITEWDKDITSSNFNNFMCIGNANENTFDFNGLSSGLKLGSTVNYIIILISGVSE